MAWVLSSCVATCEAHFGNVLDVDKQDIALQLLYPVETSSTGVYYDQVPLDRGSRALALTG